MNSNSIEGDVSESSNSERESDLSSHRPQHRHTPYQIQMLEMNFNQCPLPNEYDRCRIGQELGLTPNQVRFWYQNKRTNLKGRIEREQGYTLREENDMLKVESHSLKELIVEYTCNACKVFTPAELEKLAGVRQLQSQNLQLRHQYYHEYNSTMAMGIPVTLIQDFLPPMQVTSFNQSNGGGFLGESSMEPINANANDIMNTIMNPQQDSETWNMMQTIGLAREELLTLLNVNEPFWIKDMTDGRYIIHRDTYNTNFLNTSVRENRHQNGFRTRFESSKDEAILTMSASRVAEMLMDSKMRVDFLFSTIITEAFTIKEYGNQTSPRQVGSIKLVFEQMHLLTPFVTPRDYCFVRFCEKVTEGMWLIVEVSHDFNDSSLQLNSPSRAWRLPSGCLIKDVSHGVSQVTWVEHVEVEDNVPIHLLYKDVIFRGLAFSADRWVQTLSTSCHRMNSHYNILQNQFDSPLQKMGVLGAMTQEDRRCIMSITNKMMKRFCGNMNMINNLEMVRLNDNEVYLSLCRDQENVNPSSGLIVNVATSFWLDAPCQMVIDFLKNVNLRAQWDAVCNGGGAEEIVCIRFGDQLDNSISIIKPHIESTNNLLVIQETLVDPLGAVIAYAPIDREDFIGELYGSWSKPVLVSGFIISKDGNPECLRINNGGASTSRNVAPAFPNGSLITTAFQVMSYSKDIDMEFMNIVTSIISSTVDRIKLAFNCPDPSV